jgi:hypothetical protein
MAVQGTQPPIISQYSWSEAMWIQHLAQGFFGYGYKCGKRNVKNSVNNSGNESIINNSGNNSINKNN